MSVVIKEWKAKELKAKISGRVLDGMDAACSYAADQVSGRAPRRTPLLALEIGYNVKPERDSVVGRVGVKAGLISKSQGKAFYGLFIEMGTSKMPARPFIRPAIFENGAEIVRLIAGGK